MFVGVDGSEDMSKEIRDGNPETEVKENPIKNVQIYLSHLKVVSNFPEFHSRR